MTPEKANPLDAANGATGSLPDPFTLVIFGASGDLTRRKLLPAFHRLYCQGLLHPETRILGFARSDKTDECFRNELRESMSDTGACDGQPFDDDAWDDFASRLYYQRGAYDSTEDFAALGKQLEDLAGGTGARGNCLYYLATPPQFFAPITDQLAELGLARGAGEAWARIIIEKPFGHDLASARALNEHLRTAFDEEQIFRIDHYLGKETVQNILVLRFANSLFEHLWNHDYVDHVQITVAESLGVGARGGYYDQAGALRDMVQNHMMHLLSLIAMEPPISLTAGAIRGEKVKVLDALRPIPSVCAANGVVRAQYTAGAIDGAPVDGYRQTDGVGDDSATETFVAFKAYVDNWRWAGVPFYLRTGKCLPKRCTEISIHFQDVPRVLFNRPPAGPLAPNVLTVRVQPDEAMSLEFQVKAPGPAMTIRPLKMDFSYAESFGATPPDAYERLLLDAAVGNATLFTRSDEVEAAWRFVTPVIEGCSPAGCANLASYAAGTWGPAQADELIEADGRRWHLT